MTRVIPWVLCALLLILVAAVRCDVWEAKPEPVTVSFAESQEPESVLAARAARSTVEDDLVQERVPVSPTALTGGLVVEVTRPDDSVAVKTRVVLRAGGSHDLFADRVTTTDGDGMAQFADLEPGDYVAFAASTKVSKRVTIHAGHVLRVVLHLEAGVVVAGIVVDRAGNPVARARIVVADLRSRGVHRAYVGARSDDEGRFDLGSIPVGSTVGARATGYVSSQSRKIARYRQQPIELRLQLQGRCGEVVGRVEDSDGLPIEGALVRIGTEQTTLSSMLSRDPAAAVPPIPIDARTDAAGGFRIDGLEPGAHPIEAQAPDHAAWTGSCHAVTGGGPLLVIRLQKAAACVGTVTDSDGNPVARVEVRAGLVSPGNPAANLKTHTAADGTYRLAGLGPGRIQLTAYHRAGHVETVVELVPGQELRWDVVFPKRLVLRGMVMTEQGKPVSDRIVMALVITGSKQRLTSDRFTRTDREGRFSFPNCPETAHVKFPKGQGYSTARRWVKVADGECILVVKELKPSGMIRARLVDERGEAVTTAAATWTSRKPRNASSTPTAAVDGVLALGPLAPARYRLKIKAPGFAEHSTDERRLREHDLWDLGTVTLIRGGQAAIRIERHRVSSSGPFRVVILKASDLSIADSLEHDGGIHRSKHLVPGAYLVAVSGEGVADAAVPVEILAARDTEARLVLETGHPCEFRLVTAAERLRVSISGANGLSYHRWLERPEASPHVLVSLRLPVGRHRLTAKSPANKIGQLGFDVVDGATVTRRVVVK